MPWIAAFILTALGSSAFAITVGPGGLIDASQYGVVPGTDCTAAFQALVDSAAAIDGTTILLPTGTITISSTIVFDHPLKPHIWIKGSPGGTTIQGNVAGPLIGFNVSGNTRTTDRATIDDITFNNTNPAGIDVQLEGVYGGAIVRDNFYGNQGLVIGRVYLTNVDVSVRDCKFFGDPVAFPNGVGSDVKMLGAFYNVYCSNWGNACLHPRGQTSVFGGDFEQNRVGLDVGNQGVYQGLTFNGNLTGILVDKAVGAVKFDSVTVNGTLYHGTTWPNYGIYLADGHGGSFNLDNSVVTGNFAQSAIYLGTGGGVVYDSMTVANYGQAGSTITLINRLNPSSFSVVNLPLSISSAFFTDVPPTNLVDATQYGVVSGTIDVTDALQALVNTVPNGSTILLPPGKLSISSTIEFNARPNPQVFLKGSGNAGTRIVGTFPGPLVAFNQAGANVTAPVRIEGISFNNWDPAGIGLQLEGVNGGLITRCEFSGNQGLVIGQTQTNNVNVVITDSRFFGSEVTFPNGVGASVRMQGKLETVSCYQAGNTGLNLSGDIQGFALHCEENNVALRLSPPITGVINSMDTEANLTHIRLDPGVANFELNDINDYGDRHDGSIWPNYGWDIADGHGGGIRMLSSTIGGSFIQSAVHIGTGGDITLMGNSAGNKDNGQGGSLIVWDVADPSSVTSIQTNYTDTTPPTLSNLSVGPVTPNGAAVSWTTSKLATSRVNYGPTTSYGSSVSDNSFSLSHSLLLSRLAPGTLYHFDAQSADGSGNVATSNDMTFVSYSSPTVAISTPANGATVSGLVTLTGTANSTVGIARVEIAVDTGSFAVASGTSVWVYSLNTLLLSNASHTVTARATDALGIQASTSVTVSVNNVASIVLSPSSATLAVGATQQFTAVALDQHGNPISGVSFMFTSTNTTVASVNGSGLATGLSPGLTGIYASAGSATSNIATVTVIVPIISSVSASNIFLASATVTWVTNEPASSQVEYGTSTVYGSSTTFDPDLVLNHGQILSGLTSSTLYHYRVRSRDAYGNLAVSGDYTFATQGAPNILVQPQSQTVLVNQVATFTVTAVGTQPIAYQWQVMKQGSLSWGNITGATASSYATPPARLSMSGVKYRCQLSNSYGTVFSSAAILTVSSATLTSVTLSPSGGTYALTLTNSGTLAITPGGETVTLVVPPGAFPTVTQIFLYPIPSDAPLQSAFTFDAYDPGSLSLAVPVTVALANQRGQLCAFDPSGACLTRFQPAALTGENASITTVQLGAFALMPAFAASDLGSVKVFPNPFRPSQGHTSVTFANLTADAKVRLYTLTGELVREMDADTSGTAVWDANNASGAHAASGAYFALLQGGGQRKVLKVIVQR